MSCFNDMFVSQYLKMPTCPSCGHFFSQDLAQHLVNSECKGSVEKQSGRIGESNIPTFVKFHHVASCNTNVVMK